MTSPTIGQVDEAVREVLAGIRRAPTSIGRRRSGTFEGRLLGERQVEALGPDVQDLRIGASTVITPIARDMLKRRGIHVRLVSDSEASRRGVWGFVMEPGLPMADTIRRAIVSGDAGWREVGDDVIAATRWVTEDEDRGAVVFSAEASIACWLAAQERGVRSASPGDADSLARAAEHLGANLIVIEPAGRSIPTLTHWLKIFRKFGAPEAPEWLRGGGDHEDWRSDRAGHLLEVASEREAFSIARGRSHDSRGDYRGLIHPRGGAGGVR